MDVVESKSSHSGVVSSRPGTTEDDHTSLYGYTGTLYWDEHDHAWKKNPPSTYPTMEEPRLPDESGWHLPRHDEHHGFRMTSGTAFITTAVIGGILVLAALILFMIFYRKRKMVARRQAVLAKAQRNLCVSGLGMDNPTYVVPLNGDDKKLGLDVTTMVSAADYPALLEQCQPPSYHQATAGDHSPPPNYSLEPDDNPEQVPVLRRLSITLPEESPIDPNKTEHDV